MRFAFTACAITVVVAACHPREPRAAALPQTQVTDPRYKGLVFLVATVKRAGSDFTISNDSTQPWFDVTVALADGGADEYRLHLDEIDPGQMVSAASARFATPAGRRFDPARDRPRTLILSAEIGAGGPTGVYAVRL